ncbi:MAG: hypothetical protein ACRDY7_04395, partial [Acidimicrobiia bacterium]
MFPSTRYRTATTVPVASAAIGEITVTDPADPRLDDYRALNRPSVRRRMEAPGPGPDDPGFFVAEGPAVVERLLRSGRRVRSVLVDPSRLARLRPALESLDVPVPVAVLVASPAVLAAAAGFDVHRG